MCTYVLTRNSHIFFTHTHVYTYTHTLSHVQIHIYRHTNKIDHPHIANLPILVQLHVCLVNSNMICRCAAVMSSFFLRVVYKAGEYHHLKVPCSLYICSFLPEHDYKSLIQWHGDTYHTHIGTYRFEQFESCQRCVASRLLHSM